MNSVMTRIQCYMLAERLMAKFSSLKMGREEVAEVLSGFAVESGDAEIVPRMAALDIAIADASRRGTPADVIAYARQILEFAKPPEKVVKVDHAAGASPPKRRGRKKTSR